MSRPKQDTGGDNTPVAPLAAKAAEGTPSRLKIHPAALAFPEMSTSELQELADDIKQNGLVHPVVRNGEDLVLDGRNRLKVCEVAGVEPRFEIYRGDNPVAFIVSVNLKRRHLNESQRALVAARLATLAHGANKTPSGKFAARPDAVTQAAAAAMLNISQRSIRHATIVRDSGKPELIRDVEQGKVSVSAAAKQAKPKPQPKPHPKAAIDPQVIEPIRVAYRALVHAVEADDMARLQACLHNLVQAAKKVMK
jgi:ParB-like nuclease family protein